MKNIIKRALCFLFPDKFIFGRVYNTSKRIAITFDDGHHPANTRKLLSALKDQGVSATFFVSGIEAEKYPDLINEIKRGGHEIGNHSYLHSKISEVGLEKYIQGAEKTSLLIGESSLFRPPFGEVSLALLKFMLRSNLKYVGWTIDSRDSYIKDKEKLIESMKSRDIRSGDIILFHEDYASTVDAISEIISDLKTRGLKLVKISGLKG